MNTTTQTPTIETPTHYRFIEVTNPLPVMLRSCPIPLQNILAVHATIKTFLGREYSLCHNNVSAKNPRLLIETKKDFDKKDFLAVQEIIANATYGCPISGITEKPYHRSELVLPTPYTLTMIADAFGMYAPNFAEANFTRFFGCSIPKELGERVKSMWNGRVSLSEPYNADTDRY